MCVRLTLRKTNGWILTDHLPGEYQRAALEEEERLPSRRLDSWISTGIDCSGFQTGSETDFSNGSQICFGCRCCVARDSGFASCGDCDFGCDCRKCFFDVGTAAGTARGFWKASTIESSVEIKPNREQNCLSE